MAEAARLAIGFVQGRERADVERDPMLRLASLHAIQIIGEAAANLSDEARAAVSGIEWRAVIGMRNRLVHAYFEIDPQILWDTLRLSLPELLERLREVPGVVSPPDAEA